MSLIIDTIAICFWPATAAFAVWALERAGIRIDLERARVWRER